MSDVARAAGVSAMTVSRVFKAPGKVADETRARVQAAIETLGYVPDGVAGSLASRESRLVAALISTVAGSVFVSTIDGLNEALAEAGHQLLLGTTEYSPESEEALLTAVLGRRPDGLVLTSADHTEATRRMLANARLPIVELWDLPDTPIDAAVGFSNRAAGAAMTRLLVELGYRKIAFVGAFGEGDRRGQLRCAGYESVLSEFSLGPARRVATEAGTNLVESGAAAAAATLECWPDSDAIFCASDALALGALSEARRRGLAVPDRLAIAGFGDFEFAGESGLSLTTVRIPGRLMGYEAGRLILSMKSGAKNLPRRIDLGFELVRRSTA